MLLSPQNVPTGSCLTGSYFKISKWVSLAYGVGAFRTIPFALDLRVSGSVRDPFNSGFSLPFGSVVLLDLIPIYLLNQMFWGGVTFPVPDPRVGVPHVVLNTFTP